jgi:hypothetical protein
MSSRAFLYELTSLLWACLLRVVLSGGKTAGMFRRNIKKHSNKVVERRSGWMGGDEK